MLYAMCTGSTPFQVTTMEQLMYNMRFQEIPEINRADISPELKDLIRKLLVKNPDQRISWEDFFNHPFLFSFDSIESRLQFLREVLDLASIKASNLDTLPDSLALHFKYLTSLFDLHKALSKLQVSFSHRDRHYFICTYLLSLSLTSLPPASLLSSSFFPSLLPLSVRFESSMKLRVMIINYKTGLGNKIVNQIKQDYNAALSRTRKIVEMKVQPNGIVEELIFERAMDLGRLGIVKEICKRYGDSMNYYNKSISILKGLLAETSDPNSKQVYFPPSFPLFCTCSLTQCLLN